MVRALKRLLIVWHSATGGARAMAEAADAGARGQDAVDIVSLAAARAGADDLIAADGYLFAAPENLAAVAGMMKDFFDRSYYPALGRIEGRPYVQMVCAGNDGRNAVRQIERIAAGWRLRAVAAPLIVRTRAETPEAILATKHIAEADLERCREMGAGLAAGLALGIF